MFASSVDNARRILRDERRAVVYEEAWT